MKLIIAGVTSAILAAGIAGSVAAYRSQAGAVDTADQPKAVQSEQTARAEQPGTDVRWAPCPDDSQLENGECVTDVIRTVVVPATPAPPAPSPLAPAPSDRAPAEATTSSDRDDAERDDDERDDEGQDRDDDEDREDEEDDDGENDDGEDDDD